jgi:hypothetical protein
MSDDDNSNVSAARTRLSRKEKELLRAPACGGRAVVPDTKTWSPTLRAREYPYVSSKA